MTQDSDRPELHYSGYLQLDKLLDAQAPQSRLLGHEAHDEMLFIIVHQVYELWFREILHELDALLDVFGQPQLDERSLAGICAKLERINLIQRLMVEQIDLIETMAPQDFLEFRDLLVPASGFQSVQFRAIEIRLGLRERDRLGFEPDAFFKRFRPDEAGYLQRLAGEASLFERVDAWLARIPFLQDAHFDFWDSYRATINRMLDADRDLIARHPQLSEDDRRRELEQLAGTRQQFDCLFEPDAFERLREAGQIRLSQRAFQAALFISLYRDEPLLQQPFRLLELLIAIDEQLTAWRYRHALMVQRMLGTRIGTGGSSGHDYLRRSAERTRIFADLFNLASYLVPRSQLSPLPDSLTAKLDFHFSAVNRRT